MPDRHETETMLRARAGGSQRGDQVLTELQSWNDTLSDNNLTEKYRRMAANPLVFYRGANHLFWRDFAAEDRVQRVGQPMPHTWIQGDLHVYNFGSYDNSQGEIVYGLNDFDETIVTDPQYDIWRLAVSIVLAMRQNDELSFAQQMQVIDAYAQAYVQTMRRLSEKTERKRTTKMAFTAESTSGQLTSFLKSVSSHYSREGMLGNWTRQRDDGWRFKGKKGKLVKVDDGGDRIRAAMPAYRKTLDNPLTNDDSYFEVLDVRERLLAGTGSLGTSRFYVLVRGDGSGLRILDVKRQSKPTPYCYLGQPARKQYDHDYVNDAERHAVACRQLTQQTDPHLGWMLLGDDAYSVRERSPFKEAFPCEVLDTRTSSAVMAEQWAVNLATMHTRGNKDLPKHIDDWNGGEQHAFCSSVQQIALAYADQVRVDWRIFVDSLILPQGVQAELGINPLSYTKVLPY